MIKALTLAASLLAATSAYAGPGVIFAPVSGVVDSNGPGFGTINDTINQAGLLSNYVNGVTNFDAYIGTNPLHSPQFSPGEFFGNQGTSTLTVTYDFGAAKAFNALALWNEESSGIGRLSLLTSLDNVTFTALAIVSPFDNPLANYPAEVFSFATTTARYVRFEAAGCPQANPGTFAACAIGEVAFRAGNVPEPSSWALMIAGFGLVGAAMRRRQALIAA